MTRAVVMLPVTVKCGPLPVKRSPSAGAALCLGAMGTARIGAWLIADDGDGCVRAQDLVRAPTLGAKARPAR